MLAKLTALNHRLMPGRSLDEQMDNAFILAQQLGFDALVYDYSPVPIDLNGTLITPSVLQLRNTPSDWHALWCSEGFYQIDPVQHLALKVDSMATLLAAKDKLVAGGVEVLGPVDHTIFKSIYFFDPSGHRLELAADCGTPEMMKKLDEVKWDMLEEWSQTKRAPKHAAWMHDGSMAS